MARQLRSEFEGTPDHLLSRGARRESIFWDEKDRRAFWVITAPKDYFRNNAMLFRSMMALSMTEPAGAPVTMCVALRVIKANPMNSCANIQRIFAAT